MTCSDPCDNPCTPAPTAPCTPSPTTYEYCYYGELAPGCSGDVSESVKVLGTVGGVWQYHEIEFENTGQGDCINPTITVDYEEIDYNSPDEYVNIRAQDGTLIQQCDGLYQYECGVYGTCLTDEPLSVSSIDAGTSYRITVEASEDVHVLCSPYSLNVTVTLTCEGYCGMFLIVSFYIFTCSSLLPYCT